MKLFLSSQGVPEQFSHAFVGLFGEGSGIRLACITDASEVYAEEEKVP